MNINKEETNEIIMTSGEINQIKLAISNNNKYFVCFSINSIPKCIINENTYEFEEIGCSFNTTSDLRYKTFYFKETDEFILISKYYLITTILKNVNNSVKTCGTGNLFSIQKNDFSLIYINGYKVINYTNFTNYFEYFNISVLEENKKIEYIKEIKNIIDDSSNKEELIINLNDYIKNDFHVDYIDENKEVIISNGEKTFTFTSTYIQQMKENTNITTINLGNCEKNLKNIYNISEKSNLYILKIDIEQKGKNYPLIEYEVFYPINNGKIKILNLSFCEGTDIEISIPIIINDTLDKYNPKSDYYNDICSKATSKFNTDITVYDRRYEFIKNNMSLCEDNCELIDYDDNNKKAKCSCKVKTSLSLDDIELDNKEFIKNFLDIKKITNIEIVKCYKIVFNINNIKNNYGFFIFLFIFILYFICVIIFYWKSLKILIKEIIEIMSSTKDKKNQITKYNLFHKKKIRKQYIKKSKLETQSTMKKIKQKKN